MSTVVLGCSLWLETTSPTDSGLLTGLSSSGGGPSCQKLFPAGDVGMGSTEIQPEISLEISSGIESGMVLGLSSSGSVSSHLPLVPAAEFVKLPSPDAFVLLSSNSVSVGAGLTQPFFPFPSLSGAAELGEKIRSSLPTVQSTKPFQSYYQKAMDLREGHSAKWNEGLLADSLAASKMPICSAKNEVAAMPLLKNSVGSAKKGFLRKGFLNPRWLQLPLPRLMRPIMLG